jgi:hypothetical protein
MQAQSAKKVDHTRVREMAKKLRVAYDRMRESNLRVANSIGFAKATFDPFIVAHRDEELFREEFSNFEAEILAVFADPAPAASDKSGDGSDDAAVAANDEGEVVDSVTTAT